MISSALTKTLWHSEKFIKESRITSQNKIKIILQKISYDTNLQKLNGVDANYLFHENSTGEADCLANGGHHQAVIHPCLLKPEIIFQSWHFCFHIWQRSDEKADYGLLWKACTFYNNHHCHHDSRHDDDHHYLLSYDDH